MKYTVNITERLERKVKVEAGSITEAKQQITKQYYDGTIVLSADDYVWDSVRFDVIANDESENDNDE